MGGMGIMGDFAAEDGAALPQGYSVDKPTVSPGYFGAMGIRLARGREFTPRDDNAAPGVVIISESVARRVWPNQDAVGKRLSMANHPGPGDWLTVIGVARDVVQDRELKPHSTVYLPYLQTNAVFFINHMTYVVRTTSGASTVVPAMRAALRDVDATIPAQALQTMDASMLAVVAEPRFQTRLLTTFSILALLLAAIGTYGVLAYDVAERTREIGIRIALGAGTRDVRRLVIGRTLVFATVGILLGAIGALAATRLLARFLFAVTPTDPATFAGTAVVLIGAALGAGIVPALRATRVDPILALRQE
jgi:predicted permease